MADGGEGVGAERGAGNWTTMNRRSLRSPGRLPRAVVLRAGLLLACAATLATFWYPIAQAAGASPRTIWIAAAAFTAAGALYLVVWSASTAVEWSWRIGIGAIMLAPWVVLCAGAAMLLTPVVALVASVLTWAWTPDPPVFEVLFELAPRRTASGRAFVLLFSATDPASPQLSQESLWWARPWLVVASLVTLCLAATGGWLSTRSRWLLAAATAAAVVLVVGIIDHELGQRQPAPLTSERGWTAAVRSPRATDGAPVHLTGLWTHLQISGRSTPVVLLRPQHLEDVHIEHSALASLRAHRGFQPSIDQVDALALQARPLVLTDYRDEGDVVTTLPGQDLLSPQVVEVRGTLAPGEDEGREHGVAARIPVVRVTSLRIIGPEDTAHAVEATEAGGCARIGSFELRLDGVWRYEAATVARITMELIRASDERLVVEDVVLRGERGAALARMNDLSAAQNPFATTLPDAPLRTAPLPVSFPLDDYSIGARHSGYAQFSATGTLPSSVTVQARLHEGGASPESILRPSADTARSVLLGVGQRQRKCG